MHMFELAFAHKKQKLSKEQTQYRQVKYDKIY